MKTYQHLLIHKKLYQAILILAHYDIHNNDNKEIKHLKIVIYTNYLLCWSYILIVSLSSLRNASFEELWLIFNTIIK